MQVETMVSRAPSSSKLPLATLIDAQLILYFISSDYEDKEAYIATLKETYKKARIIGCTTGGEIAEAEALDNSAVSAAIMLERSTIRIAQKSIRPIDDSYDAGQALAAQLVDKSLKLVFVLSDGLKINGTDLIDGITDHVDKGVIVTGGLAGDGARFLETGVGIDGVPKSDIIVAIGFYGEDFRVSYGSFGGWIKFGAERLITRASGNVLYELDGKPALDLYKKYLGDEANNLPGSGLLFPLSIRPNKQSAHDIVRTIVGVNEEENSMIFAGDIPEGYIAQLMHGTTDNLVEGAEAAASFALSNAPHTSRNNHSLAILVSCIGRKLLMGQRASAEVEAVKEIMGRIPLAGFYSYGEICPHPETGKCGLHNQTMTITLLSERL